jgi:arylsulfatase A-like enzyme
MTERKRYWGHSHFTLVDETLHVPLVFVGPGIDAGVQDDTSMVELVDIAPTLTDLLGIAEQEEWGWDGDPLLGPRAVSGTTAISDRGSNYSARSAARTHGMSMTWHHGWKEFLAFDVYQGESERPRELVEAKDGHALLQARLQEYFDTQHPPSETAPIEGPEGDLLEELRSLGYME